MTWTRATWAGNGLTPQTAYRPANLRAEKNYRVDPASYPPGECRWIKTADLEQGVTLNGNNN